MFAVVDEADGAVEIAGIVAPALFATTGGIGVFAVVDEADGAVGIVGIVGIVAPAPFAGALLRAAKCTTRAATATAATRPQINTAGR